MKKKFFNQTRVFSDSFKMETETVYHEDGSIRTFPIVTVRDILETLYNKEVDGRVLIDDAVRARMEQYMETYCTVR